jgi:hypothetical protein
MATTTNYGWTTPDDTALVKDGASAIRTLGSSVDTSVKALNPGTTAGDLDYYTAATTKARIAKGTAGQVFTMNSGATAPEWQTPSSGGMTLISTTTLSGASVTLSSIPQTYNNLYVVIKDPFGSTAGRVLRVKPNATSSIADYTYNSFQSAATSNFGVTAGDLTCVAQMQTASAPTRNNFVLNIFNYTDTVVGKTFTMFGSLTNVDFSGHFAGSFRTASAITSLEFSPNSANFSGGTVLLYGVK